MRLPKSMPFLVVITFVLGLTVGAFWASAQESAAPGHKEKVLIKGADGGDYEAYKPSLVTRVQEALKKEGLYDGPANGTLDEATMNALVDYQKKKRAATERSAVAEDPPEPVEGVVTVRFRSTRKAKSDDRPEPAVAGQVGTRRCNLAL